MRREDGFTFLEMLITVAVIAMLVTAAVQAHLSITRAQERGLANLDRDRYAHVFLDRLERELSGATLIVRSEQTDRLSHPYLFLGEDRLSSDADADALRFVTRSPARGAGVGTGRGLRMVTYAVIDTDDGGLALARREEALPKALDKELSMLLDAQMVFEDLARFDLSFLDDLTGEWQAEWDSTSVALLDRLPAEVSVSLALNTESRDGEIHTGDTHERRIPLRIRELDIEALRAAAFGGAEGEAGCVTVAQCIASFREQVNAAGSEMEQSAELAIATSGDLCWDESLEIAAELRLLGANTETECAR